MKFGVDYRRLNPEEGSLTYQLEYEFLSLANFENDSVPAAFVASRSPDVQLVISNWGLFAQDTWSIARNLTLTYGLRWDVSTPSVESQNIFSFLDPEGFAAASLVCREWHSVASDDYAWKAAFDRFFGKQDVIPRLSTSWRGEYIHRSHLIRYLPYLETL